MAKKFARLGRLALLASTIVWGTSFVILKSTLDSISPMWVLAFRFTVAALVLAVFSVREFSHMDMRLVKGSVYMGLCLAAAYIVQTYGLVYTTPGKNSFLTSTYCVLVPFMAWAIYKRRPDKLDVIAAFICLIGIGFVSLGEAITDINKGDVLTLCCGVFYGLQIIIMERYAGEGSAMSISAVQLAVTAAVCWVGALLFEPAPSAITGPDWASILYMGLMCTALCFFLEAWGMQYTPSSTAAMILSLEAVFGTLFSVIFYNEKLTVKLSLGFTLIFISVIISEVKPGKAPIKSESASE